MAVYQSFKERLDLKADSSVSVYDVNSLRRVKVSVIRVSIVLVIVVVLDVLVGRGSKTLQAADSIRRRGLACVTIRQHGRAGGVAWQTD